MVAISCQTCGRRPRDDLIGTQRRADLTGVPSGGGKAYICARCRLVAWASNGRKWGALLVPIAIGLAPIAWQELRKPDPLADGRYLSAADYDVPLTPPRAGEAAVPIGNPGRWVRPEDYPARALREERQGKTEFDLRIDPDGKPFICAVRVGSGQADLDEAACQALLQRARFEPTPSGTLWSNAIRWEIPN